MLTLRFSAGTLELHHVDDDDEPVLLGCGVKRDARSRTWRVPAVAYFKVVRGLVRAKRPFVDEAKAYGQGLTSRDTDKSPRAYQQQAVDAWKAHQRRGVVVLPTGAGKTFVACMAIADADRQALVVVPTIDLLHQWAKVLEDHFDDDVGMIGGGSYDVCPLTVITYDSAHLHMEHLGAQFGLVVFDEVHHLPSPSYALAAQMALAPFRLGLTATLEREDGAEVTLDALVGPVVHTEGITDLEGDFLAAYDTERVEVELDDALRQEWQEARDVYRGFLRDQGIRMGGKSGWSAFIMRAAGSEDGQRAMRAYRRQKDIAQNAPQKRVVVEELLQRHVDEQVLVFTADNKTAYTLSRELLLPIITHQTKAKERKRILQLFGEGRYQAVVTSRVLNEGVDLPAASVAIVVSGTGTVREHVQRLGRILRKATTKDGVDKRAKLYEIVSADTAEGYTSDRRRQHAAYRSRS